MVLPLYKRDRKIVVIVTFNYEITKSPPQGIIWSSPRPKSLIKMNDLFKNAFWYIIQGTCTALLHMLKYIPGT